MPKVRNDRVIRLPETQVYYDGFDAGLEQGRAEMAEKLANATREIEALKRKLENIKKSADFHQPS